MPPRQVPLSGVIICPGKRWDSGYEANSLAYSKNSIINDCQVNSCDKSALPKGERSGTMDLRIEASHPQGRAFCAKVD